MRARGWIVVGVAAVAVAGGVWLWRSRPRTLHVPDATYRETVTAFYTALAAMQTGQDPLARREFEHAIALVPDEPASWANLGLLLLREQDMDAAGARLKKAAELAPKSDAVQRLIALLESRQGHLPQAIEAWKRAAALEPRDARAPYALALDLERQGDADALLEAQQTMAALVARYHILPAQLELARLSARNGDRAALQATIDTLAGRAGDWPAPAQEQLEELKRQAGDPAAAATRVAFLKNVLLRAPIYRREAGLVTPPRGEVGEPLVRFLALPTPNADPAPPDTALAFDVADVPGTPPGPVGSVVAAWPNVGAPPVVVAATGKDVALPGGATAGFPGAGVLPGPFGLVAADLNYDYRADFVLAGATGVRLHRQVEDGTYHDVQATSGLPAAARAPAFGAWAADIDTDGDLDIVVAPVEGPPFVLRNGGQGDLTETRPFPNVPSLRDFVWADLDGDGVPDAALLDATGRVHLLINYRGGLFSEVHAFGYPPLAALAAVNGAILFDVVGVAADGRIVRFALSNDPGGWEPKTVAKLADPPKDLAPGAARLLVADLDNNGADDLVVAGPGSSRVLLGGAKDFVELPTALPFSARAVADLDGDGRLDLPGVTPDGRAVKAMNHGAKAYRWQDLQPRAATATGDQRINSFGIGGEMELRQGLRAQRRVIEAPVVHFGLGEAEKAEVLRIVWPNGIIQSDFNTPAGGVVMATQRLKGSCPWLFAWNGTAMAWVTDLLWRSPLGLRINAQTTADVLMTEDWVKLRGDQLAVRDGAYDLRVTAELWETHFFDLVSLMAVDHPAGTEAWVDERFAIPPPPLKVIVTGPLHEMASAVAAHDEGVSELVRARDDRYVDVDHHGRYQGITEGQFVELTLPESAPRTGPLWLVGQGWVHPTDSSINVAYGQASHERLRSLSLQVPDAREEFDEWDGFRTVRANLGFPSGKDKTILIDLTGVFPPTGPRRFRLETNLEIYWDRLAWAVGRPDVKVKTARLPLDSAVLRARGFSETAQKDVSTPERPRYVVEGTAPRWLDLEGYYTRFGDVKPLLGGVDDRYVIMNAGDELALRFIPAPPPAAGVVRDFVVIGDGWVKDGDYNTTFSRTVLPLPTHASGRYDRPPGALEDDPVYRAHRGDWAEYHTRYVSPEGARQALRVPLDGSTSPP